MKVKGILKGNIVILQDPICVDKEREVIVDIPEYDREDIENMDLLDLIDYVWEKADKSRVDNRNYKEILADALAEKYGLEK